MVGDGTGAVVLIVRQAVDGGRGGDTVCEYRGRSDEVRTR